MHDPVFTSCKVDPETLQYSDDDGATFIERISPVVKLRLANMASVFAESDAEVLI